MTGIKLRECSWAPVLKTPMPNGATVSDWLSMAAIAARLASVHLEQVRDRLVSDPAKSLDFAESSLQQALDEVRQVRRHVEARL